MLFRRRCAGGLARAVARARASARDLGRHPRHHARRRAGGGCLRCLAPHHALGQSSRASRPAHTGRRACAACLPCALRAGHIARPKACMCCSFSSHEAGPRADEAAVAAADPGLAHGQLGHAGVVGAALQRRRACRGERAGRQPRGRQRRQARRCRRMTARGEEPGMHSKLKMLCRACAWLRGQHRLSCASSERCGPSAACPSAPWR